MSSNTFTILAIDDSLETLQMLEECLAREGYRVITATSGKEGMQLAIEQYPDLILLDVFMPSCDGYTVLQWLKEQPETLAIPVILVTGTSDVDDKVRGFDLGAVDFIVKPFFTNELLARVRLHIKLSLAKKVLVENMTQKLRQIQEAQAAMMARHDELPGAKFGVHYVPFLEAGGDFYDVLSIAEDMYVYFVADVAGHDIGISYFTAALKAILRQNCTPAHSPTEIMKMINGALENVLDKKTYLTALFARLNKKANTLSIINAGHPPPILMPKGGAPKIISSHGDVMGAFDDAFFTKQDIMVHPGDRVFIYTDGLYERQEKTACKKPLQSLLEICNELHATPIEKTAERIVTAMLEKIPSPQDDIVVLAFEV